MLIAVVNVYVFANGAITSSSKVLTGRLITTSNRPILVNGGEAITGTVIVSGAQLATSAASIATVELPNVATINIAPSSNVALNFDAKAVTVTVSSGDATITTADGVVGKVLNASGAPRTANPSAPAGGNTAKNWGIAGVAVGSAAFIWAIIGWNRANNARDAAAAAAAANAALAAQLAALRTCLAGQTASPVRVCTSF
ncbi:MAG TPA: hypothetical protein DC054_10085 [Blastocatellia bacterium]|nr:hypothetical protein [Blastocatellia bacterium]